jgi:hypothetical protein
MLTPEWVTACGEHILLARMSDDHIRNVIAYLASGDGVYGPMVRSGCAGFTNAEWVQLCAVELTRRQSKL